MPVQIPADLTIVTLESGGKTHPQRFTSQYALEIFNKASVIIEARAKIKFIRGECTAVTEEMPGSAQAGVVDIQGYHFLTARYRAKTGVRILFVDKVAQEEIGGRSREDDRFTLIPYSIDASSIPLRLAHELGHLLGLPHIDDGFSPEPGNEGQYAKLRLNLMYSRGLTPDALLTDKQIMAMNNSRLSRQFGGGIAAQFIPEILRKVW